MADSLLREVDDALRADRAQHIWKTYRTRIIGVAAGIIAVVAVANAWDYVRETRGGDVMLRFHAAQELFVAGKLAEAADAYAAIAADSSGDVRDLAGLWQARALLAAEKDETNTRAVAVLTEVSSRGGSLWSDIACLRLAGIDAAAASPCLNAKSSSPLKDARAEWAAAEAWAAGKEDEAMASVAALIADPATGEDSRARLTQWLASMKAGKKDAQ
jgi:hypothetical protein